MAGPPEFTPGSIHGAQFVVRARFAENIAGTPYARVTRTAGSNPFISYAVVTDGGQPGERSGDAAFVFSSP